MSETPNSSLYEFPQPVGLWRRRGASDACILAAQGLPVSDWRGAGKSDQDGYCFWHYWANGPQPETLWDGARLELGGELDLRRAGNGEHPLHRLLLRGQIAAARLWLDGADWPVGALGNGESFLHALAWSGAAGIDDLPHLGLEQLNMQNPDGLTPAMISVYRGGAEALKRWLFLGSDPDVQDGHGRSILHHVARFGDIGWFTEVQDMGASDRLRNDRGQLAADILRERMQNGTAAEARAIREHWIGRHFRLTAL